MAREVWHRVLFTGAAAVLALPALTTPAAAADVRGTVLAGTVYLPDGRTPAVAAVVDLMLADPGGRAVPGSSFARAVTDDGGAFAIDPPEWDELVVATPAAGGLDVVVRVGDLTAPRGGVPDALGHTAATVLRLVRDNGTLTFHVVLPVHTDRAVYAGGAIVTQAVALATVAWMFNDPDLVAGNENVDDPDVVPPLGMVLEAGAGVLDEIVLDGPVETPETAGRLLRPSEDDDVPNGCVRKSTIRWGGSRGVPESRPGYDWYVYLIRYKCADNDPTFDYYAYKWEGKAATKDGYRLWRLKFRAEALDARYQWEDSRPRSDVSTSSSKTLTWTVGVSQGAATGEVGGTYTFKAKKIHPWQDTKGHLLHTSWISDDKNGSTGDSLWNGFGYTFEVPQGADGMELQTVVQTWTCHWVKKSASAGYACDAR